MTEVKVFESLDDAMTHLVGKEKTAASAIQEYRSQIQEFTGHNPDRPLTPIDVVNIVRKVFFPDQGAK